MTMDGINDNYFQGLGQGQDEGGEASAQFLGRRKAQSLVVSARYDAEREF